MRLLAPLPSIIIATFIVSIAWGGDTAQRDDGAALFSFVSPPPGKQLKHTEVLTASPSTWAKGLKEKSVFHHGLSWGDKTNGWEVRVGKGGQIYSFRGPFGEAIPPQHHKGSAWNDEVWQLVSVCGPKNDRTRVNGRCPMAYFIHGSGIYTKDPSIKETFYNPILAEYATPSSYSILNWGQQAHAPSIHRSGALYYTQFNVLKDGAIELNYTIHNFGQDKLNYFNTPWGGVRHSSLPVHVLSKPDGSYQPTTFVSFSAKGILDVDKTGGWSGFFTANKPDAWGIALVFGKSKAIVQKAKVRYRWGYAGAKKNARDYFVSVVNPRMDLPADQTMRVKLFVIVDQLKNVQARAETLMKDVSYNVTQLKESPTVSHELDTANVKGSLKLSAWPVNGTKPLFLVRRTSDKKLYVVENLYRFCKPQDFKTHYPSYKGKAPLLAPYDGESHYLKLLGFAPKDYKVPR